MAKQFDIRVRNIGLNWKNSPEDITDRPKGVRNWQINLYHDPMIVGTSKENALEINSPCMCFFKPVTGIWYRGLKAGYTDDWMSANGDIEKALDYHGLEANQGIAVNNISELQRCVRKLHVEWEQRPPFAEEALRDGLLEIIRLCARGRIEIEDGKEQHLEAILAVRKKISQQFEKPWTVTEMAEMLSLSENRFSYLYKRYCGEAPQRDLIAFRMQRAIDLLTNNREMTVADVAEVCGYDDSLYFSRVFKRYHGRTPSSCRE